MRVSFLGHATVALELDGVSLLTDPLLLSRVGHLRRHADLPAETVRPDAVLLSHLHGDHLDFRSLALVPKDVPMIAPRGSAALLRRRTGRTVVELEPEETAPVGGLLIRAVPAVHASGRHPLARKVKPIGYVIEGSRQVYFAGDTDLFDGMASIAPTLDLALVPVWGWGPSVGPGHLDPARAAQAVALLRPRVAIPIHWGTYRVIGAGPEADPEAPAQLFRAEAARLAPDVEVLVLAPGGTVEL